MAFRLGNPGRNATVSGLTNIMGTGNIEIYGGGQPTLVSDSPTGTLLGTCIFSNTAFLGATSGTQNADTITPDSNADASALAGMFRIRDANDIYTIADGTAGEGGEELVFDNATIVAGGTIDITGFSITVPI